MASSNPSLGGGSASDAGNSPPPNESQEIDIDDDIDQGDDFDSTLGSESSSLRSISLTSSIHSYRYENGRRYHAYQDGKYLLPNDEREQDRLDFHHHLSRLIIGGALFRAPIGPNPQRVLDLGTGTGIWSIDFADEFPSALVLGTDLSPIQPTTVPPNCRFYVDDFESEWTFGPDEAFNFIHGRALGGCIANYELLYRRIYDNLRPGGWVEMQDYDSEICSLNDPSLLKAPNCKKWLHLCGHAYMKAGRKFVAAQEQKQKLIDAGFEDVHDDMYMLPIGTWAKDRKLKAIGSYNREYVVLCLESLTPGLIGRVHGWSKEEYQILIAEVTRELRDPKIHLYFLKRQGYICDECGVRGHRGERGERGEKGECDERGDRGECGDWVKESDEKRMHEKCWSVCKPDTDSASCYIAFHSRH